MRYSLASRFKGTLGGAIIGESIASSGEQSQSSLWCKRAILSAESLISQGRFDLDDWRQRQQQKLPDLDICSSAIFATLPVALFFHENTIKLRQNLLHMAQIWKDDPVVLDGTLAVGYAIALSVTEKLSPNTLIPQTISFLGETPTNLPQQLLKVNNLLESGARLEMVQAELSGEEKLSNAIAIAFYCFLSTLEDFRLSVRRATQNGNSQTIGVITGALSGAYNSIAGIPITWQVLLSQATLKEEWMTSYCVMLKLSDALVAVWSGVYNLAPHSDEIAQEECAMGQSISPSQVIAAPRVIRIR